MDIAKIRKKAQAQAQSQEKIQADAQGQGGGGEKTAEVVRNQVEEPAPDLASSPAEKEQTYAGADAVAPEIKAGGDSSHDEAGLVEAPKAPESGGVDGRGAGLQEDGGIAELLTFSLAKEEFAFKVSEVEEIIRFQRITLVPTMPEYVAGITSLRGKIIPVIDLRTRLALKDEGAEAVPMPKADADGLMEGTGKIIVLAGPLGLIGAIIDKVLGVVRLPDDVILQPPAHLTEDETKYIEGVVIVEKRFISIIRSEDALNIEVG
jgi:purine-binding chemotaxis protein CheW